MPVHMRIAYQTRLAVCMALSVLDLRAVQRLLLTNTDATTFLHSFGEARAI